MAMYLKIFGGLDPSLNLKLYEISKVNGDGFWGELKELAESGYKNLMEHAYYNIMLKQLSNYEESLKSLLMKSKYVEWRSSL